MSLGSLAYIGFLSSTFILFYLLPRGTSARQYLLLWVSYLFFLLISPAFVFPLLFVTFASFVGGIVIERLRDTPKQFYALLGAIVVAAAPLIFYKYGEAFLLTIDGATGPSAKLSWVFPVGISFYSLVAVAYLVDVYTGLSPAIRSLRTLALFLNFFPKLTAGPLERAAHLTPQFAEDRPFKADLAISGVKLILVGLVMKVGIADLIAEPVAEVFAQPTKFGASELLVGSVYYAYFAYADFAGYSLIALGSARLFGIELSRNFRQPLLSTTILEFWRDWHMTLFLWLRDYVFTPLRLSLRRWGTAGLAVSLIFTLIFSGVWHGARMNYVFYAIMQAIFIIVTIAVTPALSRKMKSAPIARRVMIPFQIALTFFLIIMSFIMFASPSVTEAIGAYKIIFSSDLMKLSHYRPNGPEGEKVMAAFMASSPWIVALFVGDLFVRVSPFFSIKRKIVRDTAEFLFYNACLFIVIYSYWKEATVKPFLYFNF